MMEFDPHNEEHNYISPELFESWKESLEDHLSECASCASLQSTVLEIRDSCHIGLDIPYKIDHLDGVEYFIFFHVTSSGLGKKSVCLTRRGEGFIKVREFCIGGYHYNPKGSSKILYDEKGSINKVLFHLPAGSPQVFDKYNCLTLEVSFWEYYEEASPNLRAELIKKWLPYV